MALHGWKDGRNDEWMDNGWKEGNQAHAPQQAGEALSSEGLQDQAGGL